MACVAEQENHFDCALIKARQNDQYLIEYVDYGHTAAVSRAQLRCKYLLQYFASLPLVAIRCRLANVDFDWETERKFSGLKEKVLQFCQATPIFVEFRTNSKINIYNAERRCFHDLLLQSAGCLDNYDPLQDYEDEPDFSVSYSSFPYSQMICFDHRAIRRGEPHLQRSHK